MSPILPLTGAPVGLVNFPGIDEDSPFRFALNLQRDKLVRATSGQAEPLNQVAIVPAPKENDAVTVQRVAGTAVFAQAFEGILLLGHRLDNTTRNGVALN